MASLLTPPRRYDPELLEDPHVDGRLVVRSVRDIVRSNTLFRGADAVVAELAALCQQPRQQSDQQSYQQLPAQATLLDVGTGLGDIPAKARREAHRHGVTLRTIGLDAEYVLAAHAAARISHAVCGDALRLPFPDRSVDVVTCSQVLHHFRDAEATALVREMNRVARVAVIVSDIRRSWLAAAGFWLASFPLLFHPITRHDGVVSVMRGFTTDELADTIHDALGIHPSVRRRLGFRVTTRWTPI